MTTQIEPVDRAAIAQIVIDDLRAEPQRLLPESLLRLPDVVDQLADVVAQLAEGQRVLMEGQRVIVAEQRAQGARLDALEEGQRAIVAEQRVIVAEQRAQGARLDALEEGQRAIIAEQQVLEKGQQAIITEQQAMGARMTRIENDLASVKGWGLELLCARRPSMIGQRLDLARVRTLDPGKVAEMAADARDSGTITREEHDQLIRTDVIYRGVKNSDRTPCYAVLEVSYVVDINDVRRAIARADLLSRITKMDVVSVVAGDSITEGALTAAETHGGVSNVDDVIYLRVQNGARLRS